MMVVKIQVLKGTTYASKWCHDNRAIRFSLNLSPIHYLIILLAHPNKTTGFTKKKWLKKTAQFTNKDILTEPACCDDQVSHNSLTFLSISHGQLLKSS